MEVWMAVGHITDGGMYTYVFADEDAARAFVALVAQHSGDGVFSWEALPVPVLDDAQTTYQEHREWVEED